MTGSKYTVIMNTDEEGGFGSATDVIDTEITNDENSRNRNEYGYRNVVASNIIDENIIHHTEEDDDDNNDDESFVTANTNTNMMTLSPTGQSHNIPFMSLSDAENEVSSSFRLYNSICRTTFVADDIIKVYNIIFAENAFAIKLCKFTIFTFLSIWIMFYFVRFMVRQLYRSVAISISCFNPNDIRCDEIGLLHVYLSYENESLLFVSHQFDFRLAVYHVTL